jgi:hypothetical protein
MFRSVPGVPCAEMERWNACLDTQTAKYSK